MVIRERLQRSNNRWDREKESESSPVPNPNKVKNVQIAFQNLWNRPKWKTEDGESFFETIQEKNFESKGSGDLLEVKSVFEVGQNQNLVFGEAIEKRTYWLTE